MAEYDCANYGVMVHALAKPGKEIVKGMTQDAAHLMHMAFGISGEVAELAEGIIKKKGKENYVEECGDIEFYLEGICQGLGQFVNPSRSSVKHNQFDAGRHFLDMLINTGSILDIVKKHVVYGKPLNEQFLVVHLHRLRRQLDRLYVQSNVTRDVVLLANMEKLGQRYTEGTYTDEAAIARADKG